jgi:hypothetical protein
MRRPNTDSTPKKPITLPRNQLLITLRGHESRPHFYNTVFRYAVTLQVCTHPNIFISGVTAGVARSVTAGNTVFYRWWQSWRGNVWYIWCHSLLSHLKQLMRQCLMSLVPQIMYHVFLSMLSHLMCHCKSPVQRIMWEWHRWYHSAYAFFYCNQQKRKICVNWDFQRSNDKS